jgi:hypothetical protein
MKTLFAASLLSIGLLISTPEASSQPNALSNGQKERLAMLQHALRGVASVVVLIEVNRGHSYLDFVQVTNGEVDPKRAECFQEMKAIRYPQQTRRARAARDINLGAEMAGKVSSAISGEISGNIEMKEATEVAFDELVLEEVAPRIAHSNFIGRSTKASCPFQTFGHQPNHILIRGVFFVRGKLRTLHEYSSKGKISADAFKALSALLESRGIRIDLSAAASGSGRAVSEVEEVFLPQVPIAFTPMMISEQDLRSKLDYLDKSGRYKLLAGLAAGRSDDGRLTFAMSEIRTAVRDQKLDAEYELFERSLTANQLVHFDEANENHRRYAWIINDLAVLLRLSRLSS